MLTGFFSAAHRIHLPESRSLMIRDTGGDYNVLQTLRVPVLTPRGNNNVEV